MEHDATAGQTRALEVQQWVIRSAMAAGAPWQRSTEASRLHLVLCSQWFKVGWRPRGAGTAAHEIMSVKSDFDKGIPSAWITEEDLETWPDLEAQAYDPEDPPRFETEAEYLDSLRLLTAGERKALGM